MTYISWASDLALYLEYYLMYEHPYLGIGIIITLTFDCKVDVGHFDLFCMVQ